jgi:Transposase DDE domain group 1
VAKAEANDRGTNRRFVVTNRSGAMVLPEPTYDEYAARGESENRNKEFKCDLAMDRLSDHRFVANYFRLYLHAAAMNLLARLRRFIAEPLPALLTSQPGQAAGPADEPCVAVEALTGATRQRHFRLRRQRDPLGEGHPCTWRTLLIKVAAEVFVRTRRIVVRLSSSWPHLEWYRRVCERQHNPVPTPVADPSG